MNRTTKPGYIHRLLAAGPDLAATPGVSNCVILHDDACTIFQRQPCNCEPDISIVNGGSVRVIDAHGQTHRTKKQ